MVVKELMALTSALLERKGPSIRAPTDYANDLAVQGACWVFQVGGVSGKDHEGNKWMDQKGPEGSMVSGVDTRGVGR